MERQSRQVETLGERAPQRDGNLRYLVEARDRPHPEPAQQLGHPIAGLSELGHRRRQARLRVGGSQVEEIFAVGHGRNVVVRRTGRPAGRSMVPPTATEVAWPNSSSPVSLRQRNVMRRLKLSIARHEVARHGDATPDPAMPLICGIRMRTLRTRE
jgi:hypothetical protein